MVYVISQAQAELILSLVGSIYTNLKNFDGRASGGPGRGATGGECPEVGEGEEDAA